MDVHIAWTLEYDRQMVHSVFCVIFSDLIINSCFGTLKWPTHFALSLLRCTLMWASPTSCPFPTKITSKLTFYVHLYYMWLHHFSQGPSRGYQLTFSFNELYFCSSAVSYKNWCSTLIKFIISRKFGTNV